MSFFSPSRFIARVETAPWKLEIVKECGTCHGESLKTYRDTFHGQVTALGFTLVARCSNCHGFHRIFPASDPRSSISQANHVATCQRCHPDANRNFARFSPHTDPKDKTRNPALYFTDRSMSFLIMESFPSSACTPCYGCIVPCASRPEQGDHRGDAATGRMTTKRSERMKAEPPEQPKQYYFRIHLFHRLVHGALMMSFLGLAATGTPLWFNEAPWAVQFALRSG